MFSSAVGFCTVGVGFWFCFFLKCLVFTSEDVWAVSSLCRKAVCFLLWENIPKRRFTILILLKSVVSRH